MKFNEEQFCEELYSMHENYFLNHIQQLEGTFHQEMLIKGYKYVKTAKRTVAFSFGEICISRRCYVKNGEYKYPIDEYLQLEKYSRYSINLLREIVELASIIPYRQVALLIEKFKHIYITKDTVLKGIKAANELYKQKSEFEANEIKEEGNKKIDILYIEGDGVSVKTNHCKKNRKDMSHVVIHEGIEKEYGRRKRLKNKKEIITESTHSTMEETIQYIINHYQCHSETVFITNSDLGRGYGATVFNEIAKWFGAKHEHFWDSYHIQKEINYLSFQVSNYELIRELKKSIYRHNKKKMNVILDTLESLILNPVVMERFLIFKKQLNNYFKYTNPPENRGIQIDAIGVIESQHCKITNRMKNRKMYWSSVGAITLAKVIIDVYKEGNLKELFSGNWREEYKEIEKLEKIDVTDFLQKNLQNEAKIKSVRIVNEGVTKYLDRKY